MNQQCVLNECISNNDNFSFVGIGFLYQFKSRGRELITGETEREHIKVSVSTKYRKVILENRVGVSQDKDVCG